MFEHEVNGFKGIVASRIVWDLYELDPKLGLVGGGGFDYRFDLDADPVRAAAACRRTRRRGAATSSICSRTTTRAPSPCYGHTSSLPVPTNSISLDPTVKDAWGVPAIRMTYQDHPQDMKLYKYFAERGEDLLKAVRRGADVAAAGREPGRSASTCSARAAWATIRRRPSWTSSTARTM